MAELDKYHLKNRYVTNRLGSNETLRALSLNGCGLRDRFASQLFEVLESNEALTALSLGRNVLKAESAERLAALLQTNKGLKMVSLHSNNIDDDGGVALVEALMTNKTLHEIDLRNNDLGERTAEELVEMLSENRNIIQCSVDGNKMPYRMYKKVCEFVTKNKQVYDAGITVRQETLVEKLELEEKQLSHTQKSIALHEDLERRTFRDLSEIDGSRIDFKLDQRHRTKELEMTLEGTTHESYEVRQRMYDMAQKLKQTRSISMAREARVNEAIKKEKAVSKDLHFQRQKAKDRMIKIRDSPSPLDEEIQQLTHVRNQEQRRIKGDQRELVRELENVRALVANMEARLKSKLVAKNDNAERGGRRVSSVGGLQRSRGAAIRKKKVSKGRSPRKKQSIKKKASRRK